MTSTVSVPESQAGEKTSIWEDMVDIFFAPSSVFARRHDGRYAIPALVLTAIFIVLAYAGRSLLEPIYEAEFQRGLVQAQAQNPDIGPEQIAMARKFADIGVFMGAAVFIPIVALYVGALIRLFGALFGAALTFKLSVLVAVYAQFPRALQQLLGVLQGLVLPAESLTSRYSVTFGPARFLDIDATSPLVLALADRFDIFTVWATVLIAIGFQTLGKVPRGQAYLAAALVWFCGAIPQLFGALMAG